MAPLPVHLKPMLATLAAELPADEDAWTFELKWDGIRAIAYWDGTSLRFETRNLRDVTHAWPELERLAAVLGPRPLVLDGEIATFDDRGVTSFQRLQERMHVADRRIAVRKAEEIPASYLVFDVLHLDGVNTMTRPWTERRALLDELALAGPSWATTPSFPGDGGPLLDAAREHSMEGIVAKRLDSTYVPGVRSKAWRKVKILQSDEFVVGGWFPGEGRRANQIGSLLLGAPTPDGGLAYVGNVGTGFTGAELRRLEERLAPRRRATSPFTVGAPPKRGSVFVEPELVVDVVYANRTDEGVLRQSSYKGIRIDKGPQDVDTVPGG